MSTTINVFDSALSAKLVESLAKDNSEILSEIRSLTQSVKRLEQENAKLKQDLERFRQELVEVEVSESKSLRNQAPAYYERDPSSGASLRNQAPAYYERDPSSGASPPEVRSLDSPAAVHLIRQLLSMTQRE